MANSAINPARSRPARHVSNVSCTILGEGSSFTLKKYTFIISLRKYEIGQVQLKCKWDQQICAYLQNLHWISLFNIVKDCQTSNITCMSATSTSNTSRLGWECDYSVICSACSPGWLLAAILNHHSSQHSFYWSQEFLLVPHHNTQRIQSSEI